MSEPTRTIQVTYQEPYEPQMAFGDYDEPTQFEGTQMGERTAKVRVAHAWSINDDVMDAIKEAEDDGRTVDTVVLGQYEYTILDVLYRSERGSGVEAAFSGIDLVTVPGRMVHVPKKKDRVVWDELGGR